MKIFKSPEHLNDNLKEKKLKHEAMFLTVSCGFGFTHAQLILNMA